MASKINLYECIFNEGTRLLKENENSSKDEMEENNLEDVQGILDELQAMNPDLSNSSLNTNLIDELHKVSDDINQTYIRKKERRESYKEKQRSRNSSVDESPSSSRRQSESGDNRRRSSGNFSDGSNGWSYKSSNNTYQKQRSYDGSVSMNSEFNQNGSQKKQAFRRSNSYQSGLSGRSFRRKNSGGASDMGRYKSHFPSRKISDIKEVFPPGELSHDNNSSKKEMTFERQKSQSKRMSWSGNSSTENIKVENWRSKD